MTQKELADFYGNKLSQFTTALGDIMKKIDLVSNIRLVVAVSFLVGLYFGLSNHALLYSLPLILLGFVLLVRQHSALFDKKKHLQKLINVQARELEAMQGNFSNFRAGDEFMNPHHPFTHDLDIFGEGS